jgi:taurine dioxygenase
VTRGPNAAQHVSEHPVVAVHPATNEHSLFVNPSFTSHIANLTVMESRALLELLFQQMTRPEFTVRWRWRKGDVAIWDNRATAHLAPTDLAHLSVDRRMYRVTVAGPVPIGIDGIASRAVMGEPLS